jgi:hypothetical protein
MVAAWWTRPNSRLQQWHAIAGGPSSFDAAAFQCYLVILDQQVLAHQSRRNASLLQNIRDLIYLVDWTSTYCPFGRYSDIGPFALGAVQPRCIDTASLDVLRRLEQDGGVLKRPKPRKRLCVINLDAVGDRSGFSAVCYLVTDVLKQRVIPNDACTVCASSPFLCRMGFSLKV